MILFDWKESTEHVLATFHSAHDISNQSLSVNPFCKTVGRLKVPRSANDKVAPVAQPNHSTHRQSSEIGQSLRQLLAALDLESAS